MAHCACLREDDAEFRQRHGRRAAKGAREVAETVIKNTFMRYALPPPSNELEGGQGVSIQEAAAIASPSARASTSSAASPSAARPLPSDAASDSVEAIAEAAFKSLPPIGLGSPAGAWRCLLTPAFYDAPSAEGVPSGADQVSSSAKAEH